MSTVLRDSPSGQQFHVRYTIPEDREHRYWSTVVDNEQEARHILAMARRVHAEEAAALLPAPTLHVRDVTPWREVAE